MSHSTRTFSPIRVTYLFMFAGQRCGMRVVGVVGVVGVTVVGRVTGTRTKMWRKPYIYHVHVLIIIMLF